ncbi:MAG: DUF4845 domain-containing protein [Zoogloeaceae bacterium]|jgi:Tfp pilus assembly protein FimT|nr:DUF4845 domain-containing protein [Zoogloeaceae bacterium]
MNKQKGLSLTDLILWVVVIGLVGVVVLTTVPSFIEYQQIKSTVDTIVHDSAKYATVSDVRNAFERQANIDGIETLKAKDLQVKKEGTRVIISFEYEKRVKLVGNVSLLIEYQHSTQ